MTEKINVSIDGSTVAVDPASTSPAYRERMIEVARAVMPGRVGVSVDGFAGRLLPAA